MVAKTKRLADLKRGSLIKVSFDPTAGHEQAGYRPALVLTDGVFHKNTGFVLCLPITSKQKGLLFEIEIKGKKVRGVALPHGSRMLDLLSRNFKYIEQTSSESLSKAQNVLTKLING